MQQAGDGEQQREPERGQHDLECQQDAEQQYRGGDARLELGKAAAAEPRHRAEDGAGDQSDRQQRPAAVSRRSQADGEREHQVMRIDDRLRQAR